MSNHIHFEVAYRMIDTGSLDEVLLARCYFPKGLVSIVSQRNGEFLDMCIARANELGMNVIGMKSLGGWIFSRSASDLVPDYDPKRMGQLPAAAIRWAFSDPRFHVYAIGISDRGDIDNDVKICGGDMKVTNEDRLLLADFSTQVWESDVAKTWPEVYKTADSTGDQEKIGVAIQEWQRRMREDLG
jgi:predicted aldo/keto reductase-like oxidoreductase